MNETEMARTESAFRELNEAIARTAARLEAEETDLICECADPACADRMTVELDDYEEVRANATRFLLVPGHAQPPVEEVVESTPEFDVVDKTAPEAARVARALDPRAA
jgi:hypothetical protein